MAHFIQNSPYYSFIQHRVQIEVGKILNQFMNKCDEKLLTQEEYMPDVATIFQRKITGEKFIEIPVIW